MRSYSCGVILLLVLNLMITVSPSVLPLRARKPGKRTSLYSVSGRSGFLGLIKRLRRFVNPLRALTMMGTLVLPRKSLIWLRLWATSDATLRLNVVLIRGFKDTPVSPLRGEELTNNKGRFPAGKLFISFRENMGNWLNCFTICEIIPKG